MAVQVLYRDEVIRSDALLHPPVLPHHISCGLGGNNFYSHTAHRTNTVRRQNFEPLMFYPPHLSLHTTHTHKFDSYIKLIAQRFAEGRQDKQKVNSPISRLELPGKFGPLLLVLPLQVANGERDALFSVRCQTAALRGGSGARWWCQRTATKRGFLSHYNSNNL